MGRPHHPRASRLLARVSRSVPDLLCDLIQVPALGALKGREPFVGLELLEPQQLAEGQHVPVVDVSRKRPGERTGEREWFGLVPCAYGLLEWIALRFVIVAMNWVWTPGMLNPRGVSGAI